MRFKASKSLTRVYLSERNLRTLLAKLHGHPPGSAKEIVIKNKDGDYLAVIAEEDATHYGDLGRKPGPVEPETAAHLADYDGRA